VKNIVGRIYGREVEITFINCSEERTMMKTEEGSGLTILYGPSHTELITRRRLDNGKTEIYVMDSHKNNRDSLVEDTYGDPEKFTVKYPDTELSMKNRNLYNSRLKELKDMLDNIIQPLFGRLQSVPQGEEKEKLNDEFSKAHSYYVRERDQLSGMLINAGGLGVQKDATHCISYAIRFAEKIYKTVKTDMKENGTYNVIESFGRVMDKLENHREGTTTDCDKTKEKERNMFLMPDFLLEYSGSEETLNVAIRARNVKDEEEKKELEKRLKRKLIPYKRKRAEEFEKRLAPPEKKLNEMLDTAEELGKNGDGEKNRERIEECEAKIREELENNGENLRRMNNRLCEEFAPARNWRNKHFKRVANRVREGKYPV
jgi:hypothetical protein